MAIKISVKKPKGKPSSVEKTPTAGTIVSGNPVETPSVVKAKSASLSTASASTATTKKTPKKSAAVTKLSTKNTTPQDIKSAIAPYCREALDHKQAYELSKKETDKLKKTYDASVLKIASVVKATPLAPTYTFKVGQSGAVVSVGIAQVTRTINSVKDVFNALAEIDEELPWKLMAFKVGDLDKYLGKHQVDALVTEKQTDKRTITVMEDE